MLPRSDIQGVSTGRMYDVLFGDEMVGMNALSSGTVPCEK